MNNDKNNNNKENYFRNDDEEKQPFHIVHDDNRVRDAYEPDKVSIFHAPKMKKKRRNRSILSILLTVLAASIVGVLFGIGILQMFIALNNEPAASEITPEAAQSAAAAEPVRETNAFQLPKLSGFMTQAGVFSERGNAEEWELEFTSNQVPSLLWEMEEQFFLFVGIFETEDIARIKVNELADEAELFIKPWETTAKEIQVTDEEEAWITQFHTIWSEGLMTKEMERFSDLNVITQPSSILYEISNYIETNLLEESMEQVYLDLIYLYEELGKDI